MPAGLTVVACPEPLPIKSPDFSYPRRARGKRGRRLVLATRNPSGRYVKPRLPDHGPVDLALDATLRAAAHRRVGTGMADRRLTPADLRYKKRSGKTQALLLLVVDASGSMRAQRRMSIAKQLALSFLKQAYQRRDRVAMVVFHGSRARVLLPPTGAIALAQRLLQVLPTGGKTPLAHGLLLAYRLARRELWRQQSLIPIPIVISDGNPNVPCWSTDAQADAFRVCRALARLGLPALWIDTNTNFMEPGLGPLLARALNCPYERFETLAPALGLAHLVPKPQQELFYWTPT